MHLQLADQQNEQLEQLINGREQGIFAYLFIKNYRDIWADGGFIEAEKFFSAIAQCLEQIASADYVRYTDDGVLLFFNHNDSEAIEEQLNVLAKKLDNLSPSDMKRPIRPICYLSFIALSMTETPQKLISQLFRSTYHASLSSSGDRVSQPSERSRRGSEQQALIKSLINNNAFSLRYQAIANFQADNKERYTLRLALTENEQDLEIDNLIDSAERYQLMHDIDQWQISHFFDYLPTSAVPHNDRITLYIPISADSLKEAQFVPWLQSKVMNSGMAQRFVFQINARNIDTAHAEAQVFSETVKTWGAQIAIAGLDNLKEPNRKLFNDLNPNTLRFDMREIITLDDNEIDEFLYKLCQHAEQLQATVIADYLTSPAQLAAIWQHNIHLVQAEDLTPVRAQLDFDFAAHTLPANRHHSVN